MAVAWQFWVFFAAMHPLLKPAIWIGEVLHSSPGPSIEFQGGDFMPWSFVAGNVAVIGALAFSKRLSGFVNVALLGLFINFVGLGLEGALDNGEYNLALNDGVKGCPTYQQVVQPSMADFDVKKYTGRWYEHAFHDYTQFSDVYDTTLDIELSADGTRWLDDFALRGPSPKARPRPPPPVASVRLFPAPRSSPRRAPPAGRPYRPAGPRGTAPLCGSRRATGGASLVGQVAGGQRRALLPLRQAQPRAARRAAGELPIAPPCRMTTSPPTPLPPATTAPSPPPGPSVS